MADNVGYTPGIGATVAADDINGALYQRMKLTHGPDGTAVDVHNDAPLPVQAQRTDDLTVMLGRLVKLLESNAIVDQQQRQRITLDAISAALTLATVTTVGTVSNITANAGMDREQYINIAKQTYANSIRPHLSFV